MTMRMSDSQIYLMNEFIRHFFNVLDRDKQGHFSDKFSTDSLNDLWNLRESITKHIEETKGETIAAMF
jgi:hypothetical protein